MKNLFSLVVILLIVHSQCCFGQYDWKEGLIIHNNGDTVHGYIDDRVISTSQRECFFKNGYNGQIENFRPFQILGYRISNGKFYVSKTIRFSEKEDSMFLEFLIKGKVSIYHYLGANDRYFIEKDGWLTELENTETKVSIGDKQYLKKKNEYIGTLNIILQDAQMSHEILKTSYNRESLINIAKKYNEKMCPEEKCTIYEREKKEKAKFDFGLTIGMSNQTIEHAYSLNSDYKLKNKASYYGGIALSLYNLPGGFKNFSVNGEALITSFYLENKLYKCMNIPLFLGFRLTDKKIYPQVEVGLSNYFKQSEFDLSPLFGMGIHYRKNTGPGFYLRARVEHIPAYFRFGAGIVF